MQQEAAKTLNFATQKTMRVAQGLYEGTAIKGRGTIGLITYLRTDSTRISDEANRVLLILSEKVMAGSILTRTKKPERVKKRYRMHMRR